MAKRGRESQASLSVVGSVSTLTRVAPPSGLTPQQRRLWLAIVNSKPAEWFGDEHVPQLVQYVRHLATEEMLAQKIEAFDPDWMDDEEGMRRMKTLVDMRAKEAQTTNMLARSMRLTHQSVYPAAKANTLANKGGGRRKPWQQQNEPEN